MPKLRKKPDLYVNRNDFIAWTKGILLERSKSGQIIIGDNKDHQKAEQLLRAGKTIGLLVDGRLVSTISSEEDDTGEHSYVEKNIKEST